MKRRDLISLVLFISACLGSAAAGFAQGVNCGEKDYDCKIQMYRAKIKADPKDTESYYSLAWNLQAKGDYASSVGVLDLYLVSGSPKAEYLADAYNMRGFAQKKVGKDALAVKDFTKAIELFPKAHFYKNRGDSYANMKQLDLAVTDHTKAINMDPKYTGAFFARGYAYMEQKNNLPAIADFTKVIALDPEEGEAFYNRGTLYYRVQKYALAVADLDRYIALNTSDPHLMADGYINRGLAYFYLGNYTKAVEDYTRTIEINPAMKNAYLYRADAYRKQGKTAAAAADDAKAATLN